MNTTAKLVLVTASLALSTSVAHADTVAPRPVHQPENISEINGQLVEVGDHNKYDFSYKRFNVAANPLGAMVGIYGFQGSLALNSMIALRGDVTLYDLPNSDQTGIEFTGSAAFYFKHMYKGLFLEPGVMVRTMSTYDDETETTMGPQTLLGYHWLWDSGLNASVAMGGGRNLIDSDTGDETFFNGYARFGYAF